MCYIYRRNNSGKYLNLTEYIRSNDMFRGWPLNMYALIRIGEYIVNEINKRTNKGYELGIVTTISTSDIYTNIISSIWKRY